MRTSFYNKTEPRHTSIFDIHAHLSANLPGRWLGRISQSDSPFLTWPPWSPDLTPLQFFSYGVTSRNMCTCPLYHVIYHSFDKGSWRRSLLSADMLQLVWQELDYRFDICRITSGGHFKHPLDTTETLSVSPSVDKLPFCVTIAATVLQRSEILEGLTNYPILRIEHLTLLITIIMLLMRIYSNVVCRSQNCFSENEHLKRQLAEMLKLLHFTSKLSVLCCMLIGVVFSLSGTSCIACVSAVHILYELYTVM